MSTFLSKPALRASAFLASFLLLPTPLFASQEGMVSATDPVSQTIVGVLIVLLFVLLAMEAAHRVLVAMGTVAVLWIFTYFTPWKLIGFEKSAEHLDVNVLLLLAGMMAIVGVLKATGAFAWAVGRVLERTKGHPLAASRLVAWFTGVLSANLDNVTTVIFVTPMATGMSRRIGLAPVAILLPMVVASNIGGTATLIGDPPNIMIGSGANLSYMAFMENLTAPILIMMVVLMWYLQRYYRSDFAVAKAPTEGVHTDVQISDPTLYRWMIVICLFVLAGFLTHSITHMPVAVPAVLGAAAALIVQDRLYMRKHKPTAHERAHGILEVLERDIEWPTLSFFVFLFIVVGAAVETGLIASVAKGVSTLITTVSTTFSLSEAGTLIFAAILICWVSAVLSAFIDNIPYVAVSIPLIHQLAPTLPGETEVLWWALSLGACLGGNATVVGASANVTTVGLAEKEGVRISFLQYSKFAAPIATLTVVVSSFFLVGYVLLGSKTIHWVTWPLAIVVVGYDYLKGRRLLENA
jgi:Na+/H+ antiporter NhaD/arsenite permease-like protein